MKLSFASMGVAVLVLGSAACSTIFALPERATSGGGGGGGCATCQPFASSASGAAGGGDAGGAAPSVTSACIAAVVSNSADPTKAGKGVESRWSYAGHIGLSAGEEMCHAVGADHVCTLEEIFAADAAGQLADLPADLSYWSYRTQPVVDPVLGKKPCTVDAGTGIGSDSDWQKAVDHRGNTHDCDGGPGKFCDPVTQLCSLEAGPGARCNDFVYPTGHLWDGEWFARADASVPTSPSGGTKIGSLVVHFDGDVALGHTCHASSFPGCAGPCGGGQRAIVCCKAKCD